MTIEEAMMQVPHGPGCAHAPCGDDCPRHVIRSVLRGSRRQEKKHEALHRRTERVRLTAAVIQGALVSAPSYLSNASLRGQLAADALHLADAVIALLDKPPEV